MAIIFDRDEDYAAWLREPVTLPSEGPPKKSRKPPVQWETAKQTAFFQWVHTFEGQYPALRRVTHVPNSFHAYGATRQQNMLAWKKMERLGARKGVPDILCFVPAHGFPGSVAEFKHGGNPLTDEQSDWIAYLASIGWDRRVFYEWNEAAAFYCYYLSLPGYLLEGLGDFPDPASLGRIL